MRHQRQHDYLMRKSKSFVRFIAEEARTEQMKKKQLFSILSEDASKEDINITPDGLQ